MSLDLEQRAEPVSSIEQLLAYFRQAERSPDEFKVGLEHEKLVYPAGGTRPIPYEGEQAIGALFSALVAQGYSPFRESAELPIIALTRDEQTLSLEPGGQLELSGSPALTARAAHQENLQHLSQLKAAGAALGLSFVTLGYRPFERLDSIPWMPKTRYRVMRRTLGERGELAVHMMLMTATGQVSLDWSDEADCARKVVVAARLTPLIVAIYANSPLAEGKPTGWMSFRSHVWTEVDPSRCGYLEAMFDGSFSYRAYAEWALDAPLLFLRRRGEYLAPRLTFRQLLAQGFEGSPALYDDWVDHLSTLFPEVRIKAVMELRGADCCTAELTAALCALMRGIIYDSTALDEAERLLPRLTYSEHLSFHLLAGRQGLSGKLGRAKLFELAKELVEIGRRGLIRLDPLDAPLLDPLLELVEAGRSPAEWVLDAFARDPDPARLLARFSL
jgi:glutamate--cysteine ligase